MWEAFVRASGLAGWWVLPYWIFRVGAMLAAWEIWLTERFVGVCMLPVLATWCAVSLQLSRRFRGGNGLMLALVLLPFVCSLFIDHVPSIPGAYVWLFSELVAWGGLVA